MTLCPTIGQAVCVTACGNFGIAASSKGVIHMYNMQSGVLRRSFNVGPCPANAASRLRPTEGKKKEERCITGIVSDALDRVLVAGTLDGTINVRFLCEIVTPSSLTLSNSSLTSIQLHWSIRSFCRLQSLRSLSTATVTSSLSSVMTLLCAL